MMTQSLIDDAKHLASAQCGIPVDHLMVSATHTHSAPAAMARLASRIGSLAQRLGLPNPSLHRGPLSTAVRSARE